MESANFLQDLAVVLLAAGFAALLFYKLNQPLVIGYILAGLLLGPHTPPFSLIQEQATIRLLADLGLIFLMFSLGLEFNLRRLRKVGAPAGLSAIADVTFMLGLGYLLGRALGWPAVESLFLGGMICDSSTTILAKTLQEMGRIRDKFASLVIGVTVIEDILAVAIIAVLTGLAMTGTVQADLVAVKLWELILFLMAVVVVGLLTIPRLLNYLRRFDNDELLVVALLGVCFGVTLVGARLELSLALGAVLVGAIASESTAGDRLSLLIAPLRHVFSAIFFVAIGLMLDPAMLIRYWGPILAVTALVIAGKFTSNTVAALLTGSDMPTAIRAGAGLAQIGEFALIIASLGVSLGVTSEAFYPVGVSAAVLTTLLSPYLLRGADRLADFVEHNPAWHQRTRSFRLYGQLVDTISHKKPDTVIRKAMRRSVVIMVVNTILIAAAIATAGYLARKPLALFPSLAARPGLFEAVLWLGAMLVCLPLYVATLRKLQAVGMILAELGVPMTLTGAWARHLRGFVANAILAAGSFGLALLTFVLSSAMLPSWKIRIPLMIGAAIIAFWRWPALVKVYAQAQGSLRNILNADNRTETPGPAFEVNVQTAVIGAESPLAGRELHSIRLRSRTGATVVGIERGGVEITNPGPAERLHAGDRLFLLGDPEQIRRVLNLIEERRA
ncbi:MAG: cation:proton antiporter [Kiritimatiellia bacterium]